MFSRPCDHCFERCEVEITTTISGRKVLYYLPPTMSSKQLIWELQSRRNRSSHKSQKKSTLDLGNRGVDSGSTCDLVWRVHLITMLYGFVTSIPIGGEWHWNLQEEGLGLRPNSEGGKFSMSVRHEEKSQNKLNLDDCHVWFVSRDVATPTSQWRWRSKRWPLVVTTITIWQWPKASTMTQQDQYYIWLGHFVEDLSYKNLPE